LSTEEQNKGPDEDKCARSLDANILGGEDEEEVIQGAGKFCYIEMI